MPTTPETLTAKDPRIHIERSAEGQRATLKELVDAYNNGKGSLPAGELLRIIPHLKPVSYERRSIYMPPSLGHRLHLGQLGSVLANVGKYAFYTAATAATAALIVRGGS